MSQSIYNTSPYNPRAGEVSVHDYKTNYNGRTRYNSPPQRRRYTGSDSSFSAQPPKPVYERADQISNTTPITAKYRSSSARRSYRNQNDINQSLSRSVSPLRSRRIHSRSTTYPPLNCRSQSVSPARTRYFNEKPINAHRQRDPSPQNHIDHTSHSIEHYGNERYYDERVYAHEGNRKENDEQTFAKSYAGRREYDTNMSMYRLEQDNTSRQKNLNYRTHHRDIGPRTETHDRDTYSRELDWREKDTKRHVGRGYEGRSREERSIGRGYEERSREERSIGRGYEKRSREEKRDCSVTRRIYGESYGEFTEKRMGTMEGRDFGYSRRDYESRDRMIGRQREQHYP